MNWSIEITRGENGYKCGFYVEVDDEGGREWKEAYIQDDEIDDLKSGEALLWFIMEYFAFGGSKHDPERLRIVREKPDGTIVE
jgi:hypothetical protein